MINAKIKILKNGCMPEKKHSGDACFDCRAGCDINLKPNEREKVALGFSLELPEGYEAVIRPRSGMSLSRIDTIVGTIDSNYRGEVNAIVQNNTGKTIGIRIGDRICQMAIREVPQVMFDVVEELTPTDRNENGFGSTGI